jgi:L-arabinose transport system permease protein
MTTTTPTGGAKGPPLDYSGPKPGSASRGAQASWVQGVWDAAGMALVLVLMLIIASFTVENFATWRNAEALLESVATVGMISCTMLFCLAAGDFDLSVGSTVAMTGVLAALVCNATHSLILGIGCGLIAGGIVGLVNGFVIARIGINALITTLASMQIVRGLALILSKDGRSVSIASESFWQLGIGRVFNVPMPIIFMVACFIIFGILLHRTTFGRNTLAIGGNMEAARLAGVSVVRTKIMIFALQGMVSALAGMVLAARMTSGHPKNGEGLELQVISACVLGGVSLTGGIGTIFGAVIGVLIMGVVNNAMNLLHINSFYQYVASGSILLAAVLFDRLKQWRTRG